MTTRGIVGLPSRRIATVAVAAIVLLQIEHVWLGLMTCPSS
jgi:hypothetical protein